ncbi:pyrrolo-quinoline quinone [Bremerella cremea]|uniref:Pyrrolo-quinoline quinone n=1 Tax=Bremerella cremea TaxID=1031537 RepID=A0A368KJN8_9BACT|nr:PQQ-binding-like beta-propeller repeat protein [Bremerella cremea]RCS40774.1 pyrrolo-quinoline quinone [Bremerella cremea]
MIHDKSTLPSTTGALIAWVLLTLGVLATSVYADEPPRSATPCWPEFLGRNATPLDPASLPLTWSPTENIAWQTKLDGGGQSSPVIWGDKVFVTSIAGSMKNECLVTCLSLTDGSILWTWRGESSQPVRSNYFQSRSAPTPVVDEQQVIAFFETGNLVALNHDGEPLWERSLTEDYGEFEVRIGLAASLTQTADTVFVLVDHEGPSYLLAVDKRNGETRWQTERFSRQSYASPTILSIGGKQQIVCSSAGSVDGYDPQTGEMLWTFEDVGGNRACTPLPFGDGRFLVGASPGMHDEHINEASQSNFLMNVQAEGETFEPTIAWHAEKAMPTFGSPMIYRGLAYWVTSTGVLYCFDAETGQRVYIKRSGQPCWATPLGVGERIYLFGKDGLTTVIAAGPKYQVLSKNELMVGATEKGEADIKRRETRRHGSSDSSAAKPEGEATEEESSGRPTTRDGLTFAEDVQYGYAVVNGSLVVRTGSVVHCLKMPAAAATSSAPAGE